MYYKALNISDQRKGFKNAIAESSSEVLLTFKISILFNHRQQNNRSMKLRSSHPEVFLEKGVLKICSKFTGVHPCRNVISIKLLCNFIEIALRHGCPPVNLQHIFRKPFSKSTSGRLLLIFSETEIRKIVGKSMK